MQVLDDPLYSNFINSLKSPYTKKHYSYALRQFMSFHSIIEYSSLLVTPEDKIKDYVIFLQKKGASNSQYKILFGCLKNFYEMNDVEDIKWKKLKRFQGEDVPNHEDRRYTHEEVQILVNNANLKLKACILLMASSGCRVGSLPSMLVGHLEKRGDLYKVNVYKGQKGKGQYYTFCTPEATKAIDSYLEFRERCGEKLNPSSPLFRRDFNFEDPQQARFEVYPWSIHSIKNGLRTLLIRNGLREVDHVNPSTNRKDVKLSHGFRKFFVTMLVNSNLQETIVSKLTGHTISKNLIQVYSKQTEAEMLLEYQKAVDSLTIDPANRLQRKVQILEKDNNQFAELRKELVELKSKINSLGAKK